MHRANFVPPARSPPLHHPVPQHVSTVPMMRSPPLQVPQPQQPQPQPAAYGNPYQPSPVHGGGNGAYAPGFGGFINDPTAQMGFQVGKSAMMAGHDYMEQNVSSIIGGYFGLEGVWPRGSTLQLTDIAMVGDIA